MNFLDHGVIDGIKPIGGGWRYLQVHQGATWRIPHEGSEKTAETLVKAVESFRIANGIEVGDPFHDVCEFIKKVSPRNDRWQGRKIGKVRVHEITPLIQDLRIWCDRTAEAKPRFVLSEDARDRARVCMTCAQNVVWRTRACGACNEEVERRSYLLRQAKTAPPEDEAMRGCRLHRVDLKSAIHLDRDFLHRGTTTRPSIAGSRDKMRHYEQEKDIEPPRVRHVQRSDHRPGRRRARH